MAVIAILSIPASMLIWFLVLRPYARSHGGGYTAGSEYWDHRLGRLAARKGDCEGPAG